jgi:hypothetical protein
MALAGQEKRQVTQPAESEAAVTRWKAAPSVVEHVLVLLGADFVCDELVVRCAWLGLASRNEIGSWPSNGVLDEIRNKECEDQ